MAGHRLQRTVPTQRETRKQRCRTRLARRYAAAGTPAERLQVAYDYLRAATRQLDPVATGRLLEELTGVLIATADQFLAARARGNKRTR